MPSSIDLLAMTAASAFDTYEFAIFVSNIAFFLLIAAFASVLSGVFLWLRLKRPKWQKDASGKN
jgi:hypothetical protein